MIRLATVFSGIGAIEHALQRMQIEHKIVFACDNGDVDVLSKYIDPVLSKIRIEINELEILSQQLIVGTDEESDFYMNYRNTLFSLRQRVDVLSDAAPQDFSDIKELVKKILVEIISNNAIKSSKRKEYSILNQNIEVENTSDSYYAILDAIVVILRDFKKNNSMALLSNGDKEIHLTSSDNIPWNKYLMSLKKIYDIQESTNAKKIIKEIKDISERIGMIHEKIKTFSILKIIKPMSYSKKKEYVDSLYKDKANQNQVRKSYLANYKIEEKDFHWNVSFLDGKQYQNQVDLFVGGSPCQSFSLVGKQRGLDDTRGTLFYEYARLIDEIQPKVFIYENVKALLNNDNGRTWKIMQNVFDSLGYEWKAQVLNAKNYGIPQNRERVFVVGVRKDLTRGRKYQFPNPIPLDIKMQDLLLDNVSDLYSLSQKGISFVTDPKNLEKRFTQINGEIALCQKKSQQYNWHGDFVFEQTKTESEVRESLQKYYLSDKVLDYVMSSGTKTFVSRPKIDLDIARPLLTSMHKMHRAGVDNYVTSFGRIRKLTPRECLRLMGFDDSFKIVVCDTSMYQQAGNSIVVDVLMHIMDNILCCFEGIFE